MNDAAELKRVTRQWREKAEEDFRSALILLRARDPRLAGTICFHAQQAVEKYIKARLVQCRIGFPKTHSVRQLVRFLPGEAPTDLSEAEQDLLTDYAVIVRYPGDEVRISLRDAEEALGIARRMRRQFRKMLAED
jgi:HEPN domain-containing protein